MMGLMDVLKDVGKTATRVAPALRVLGANDKRQLYPAIDAMNTQQAQYEKQDAYENIANQLADTGITSMAEFQKLLFDNNLTEQGTALQPQVQKEKEAEQERVGLSNTIGILDPSMNIPKNMSVSGYTNLLKIVQDRIKQKQVKDLAAVTRTNKLTDARTNREAETVAKKEYWKYQGDNPKPHTPTAGELKAEQLGKQVADVDATQLEQKKTIMRQIRDKMLAEGKGPFEIRSALERFEKEGNALFNN